MPRKGFFDWFRRKPKAPKPPEIPSTGGHQGVALGWGSEPTTRPNNRRTIPASEVDDFVNGGYPFFVTSSNVAMMQYYPQDEKLMIEYLNGAAYLYSNVTKAEAIAFATAHSKGVAVWDMIRVRGAGNSHLTRKPFVRIRSVINLEKVPEATEEGVPIVDLTNMEPLPPEFEIDLNDLEPLSETPEEDRGRFPGRGFTGQ